MGCAFKQVNLDYSMRTNLAALRFAGRIRFAVAESHSSTESQPSLLVMDGQVPRPHIFLQCAVSSASFLNFTLASLIVSAIRRAG